MELPNPSRRQDLETRAYQGRSCGQAVGIRRNEAVVRLCGEVDDHACSFVSASASFARTNGTSESGFVRVLR
jgi:hypothetical protein